MGRLLPFILTITLSGQVYAAEQSVLESLMRMQNALHDLNYQGTLIYFQNGTVQPMRVLHQSTESGEREKLINLNGEPIEIIRADDIVTCYWPDKKEATVGKRHHDWNILSRLVKNDFSSLQKLYEFVEESNDRIAGHTTRRILIKPRDQLRYGYRLWLDSDTSLLLKSALLGVNGQAIEQAMFTDISVVDRIPDESILPSFSREQFNWLEQGGVSESQMDNNKSWKFEALPEGFTISAHDAKKLPEDERPTDYWIATDGLATVSVYAEKVADREETFMGFSHSGAMNIFGLPVDGLQITAVGEVPEHTVEMIARSISRHYVEASND